MDGLPMDVLIRGTLDQNRAIHDDTVYLQMQPLKRWFVINSIKSTMANADRYDAWRDAWITGLAASFLAKQCASFAPS